MSVFPPGMRSSPRFILLLSFLYLGLSGLTVLWGQSARVANPHLYLPASTPPEATAGKTYSIVQAFPSLPFDQPMGSTYPPGETGVLYVIERGGKIWRVTGLSGSNPSKSLFLDIAPHLQQASRSLRTDNENGLLAMAFHPNYSQNGWFYLYYSIQAGGKLHQRLARFQAIGTAGAYRSATTALPASEIPMLTLYDRAGNHNGGDLGFGPDGYLYISLGDEGGGNDEYNNARFITKNFWGQVLRLDVNGLPGNLPPSELPQAASTAFPSGVHPGTYRVPANNPFIGRTTWHGRSFAASAVKNEIYATGFRNPFRFNFDAQTGRLYLGDVGQDFREEVNLVVAGGDYGWSWREGDQPFNDSPKYPNDSAGNTNTPPSGSAFTPVAPIISYPRSLAYNPVMHGSSVCGGLVYRGTLFPELVGSYLVSDIYSGSFRAFKETTPGQWTALGLFYKPGLVDFGVDPSSGEPLFCCLNDGHLYKLVRGTPYYAPALLAEVGIFSNLPNLTPNPGVVAYQPNVSFWSDGATKRRWYTHKETAPKIGYNEAGNWTFPTGMVWVKHFDILHQNVNKRLETRVLMKTTDGVYGLTYKWRADNSDADLVSANGETSLIPNSGQSWRYPSRGECLNCHTAAAGYALSFNTAQLNGKTTFTGNLSSHIEVLAQTGYMTGYTGTSTRYLPALSTATTQSLEWRVRSYLEVNCAPCHQPGGGAQGNWDARHSSPTALSQIINGMLVNQGSDPASRVLVPGDAEHSMLLKRMQGQAGSLTRMPPVGSIARDSEGEALIAAWIEELAGYQTLSQWLEQQFGPEPGPSGLAAADADGDGYSNEEEYILKTDPKDAASRWRCDSILISGGRMIVGFTQLANRQALVETSRDLITWRPLNLVDNNALYPVGSVNRSFFINLTEKKGYFRIRWKRP